MAESFQQLAPRIACFVETLVKDGKLGVTESSVQIVDVNTGWALTWTMHRRLADGTDHCAGSATYQICFRLPIPNPNPKPITDPNPNPKNNKKENDTGMKLNIPVV